MTLQHLLTRDIFDRAMFGKSKDGIELKPSPKKKKFIYSGYNIPDQDEIFLLVDLTKFSLFGSDFYSFVITTSGIYWRDDSSDKEKKNYPEYGIHWDDIQNYQFGIDFDIIYIEQYSVKLNEGYIASNLLNIVEDIAINFKLKLLIKRRNNRRKIFTCNLPRKVFLQKVQWKESNYIRIDLEDNVTRILKEKYHLLYGDDIFLVIDNKKFMNTYGILVTIFGIYWDSGDNYPKNGIRWDDIKQYDFSINKDENEIGIGSEYNILFPGKYELRYFLELIYDIAEYFNIHITVINYLDRTLRREDFEKIIQNKSDAGIEKIDKGKRTSKIDCICRYCNVPYFDEAFMSVEFGSKKKRSNFIMTASGIYWKNIDNHKYPIRGIKWGEFNKSYIIIHDNKLCFDSNYELVIENSDCSAKKLERIIIELFNSINDINEDLKKEEENDEQLRYIILKMKKNMNVGGTNDEQLNRDNTVVKTVDVQNSIRTIDGFLDSCSRIADTIGGPWGIGTKLIISVGKYIYDNKGRCESYKREDIVQNENDNIESCNELILRFIVYAANANGKIDEKEKNIIYSIAKEWFPDKYEKISQRIDQIRKELVDPRKLVRQAHSEGQVFDFELYTLSFLVMNRKDASDFAYLNTLAKELHIDYDTKIALEQEIQNAKERIGRT